MFVVEIEVPLSKPFFLTVETSQSPTITLIPFPNRYFESVKLSFRRSPMLFTKIPSLQLSFNRPVQAVTHPYLISTGTQTLKLPTFPSFFPFSNRSFENVKLRFHFSSLLITKIPSFQQTCTSCDVFLSSKLRHHSTSVARSL